MLYTQWVIPIVIKSTTFIEIVAAMMLNGVPHRTKLLCCQLFDFHSPFLVDRIYGFHFRIRGKVRWPVLSVPYIHPYGFVRWYVWYA